MKFLKKPIMVDAFRYNVDSTPDWFKDEKAVVHALKIDSDTVFYTREGQVVAHNGDWIVRDYAGDIRSHTPEAFEQNYEKIQ